MSEEVEDELKHHTARLVEAYLEREGYKETAALFRREADMLLQARRQDHPAAVLRPLVDIVGEYVHLVRVARGRQRWVQSLAGSARLQGKYMRLFHTMTVMLEDYASLTAGREELLVDDYLIANDSLAPNSVPNSSSSSSTAVATRERVSSSTSHPSHLPPAPRKVLPSTPPATPIPGSPASPPFQSGDGIESLRKKPRRVTPRVVHSSMQQQSDHGDSFNNDPTISADGYASGYSPRSPGGSHSDIPMNDPRSSPGAFSLMFDMIESGDNSNSKSAPFRSVMNQGATGNSSSSLASNFYGEDSRSRSVDPSSVLKSPPALMMSPPPHVSGSALVTNQSVEKSAISVPPSNFSTVETPKTIPNPPSNSGVGSLYSPGSPGSVGRRKPIHIPLNR